MNGGETTTFPVVGEQSWCGEWRGVDTLKQVDTAPVEPKTPLEKLRAAK